MDRHFVYPGAIPQDTDILHVQRDAMVGHGYLGQMLLGSNAVAITGLACTPTVPASMVVNVGQGCIATMSTIDATAFGSLAANTNPLMKMGINAVGSTPFTLTAPTISGQSVVYLIEATLSEVDNTPVVLPYYNVGNPANPFSGPNNSGATNNTVRQQLVSLELKAGVPTNTGSQVAPAVDAGYIGLYTITVAYGQTTVTAASIIPYANAPFVKPLGRVYSWTYPTFQPPQDVYLNVGDKAVINFVNASLSAEIEVQYTAGGNLSVGYGMPLCIQTVPGVYRMRHVEYASNTTNDDHYIYPNNNPSYGAVFQSCYISSTDDLLSAVSTAGEGGVYGIVAATALQNTTTNYDWPAYSIFQQPATGFYIDTYTGPSAGVPQGAGPRTHEMLISTYTQNKMMQWWTWGRGGPTRGNALWLDTTTPWTSLGCTYVGTVPATSASGVVIIERLV